MEKSSKWGKAEGQGTGKSGKETIKQFKDYTWNVLFKLTSFIFILSKTLRRILNNFREQILLCVEILRGKWFSDDLSEIRNNSHSFIHSFNTYSMLCTLCGTEDTELNKSPWPKKR